MTSIYKMSLRRTTNLHNTNIIGVTEKYEVEVKCYKNNECETNVPKKLSDDDDELEILLHKLEQKKKEKMEAKAPKV